MSSKLRNTEAVQQMLQGTHRTQTRKVFAIPENTDNPFSDKNRGDYWEHTDEEGVTTYWMMKNSPIQISYSSYLYGTDIDEYNRLYRNDSLCSSCNSIKSGQADMKLIKKTGICLDCTVEKDTKLIYTDKFGNAQQDRLKSSAISFIKDTDAEFEDMMQNLPSILNPEVVHQDGDTEKFVYNGNIDETEKMLRTDYADFRKLVMQHYGIDESEIYT